MTSPWKEEKYISPEALEEKVLQLRKEGKMIATLNGSFDLLHAGHLKIIHEASEQADILLMALNSDSSIQEYKSPFRPIIPLENRLEMVAALQFVDYVTYFNETDPIAFLEMVKPDVHINGAEYGDKCVEAKVVKKYGGRIHIVQLASGFSTSHLIKKIKSCV